SGGFGLPGDARDVGVIIADRGPALHTVLRRPAVRRLAVRALVVAPDVDVVVDGDLLVLGREIAAGRILRRTALRTAPVRLAEQLPRAARRAIPEHLVDGHALDLGARESVRASRHASRKSSAEHPCTGPQLGWAGRAPRRRGAVSIAATPLASLASPQPGYEWGPRRSISRTLRISASC